MEKNQKVRFLTEAGLIAAAYAALTYLSSLFGIAYGPVQFRFSEALCLLPVLTPAALPGLALGCLIANLGSPLGPVDLLFGTAATLLAALLTRAARGICFRRLPLLSALFPALINGLIIGAEIVLFLQDSTFTLPAYLSAAGSVALGEAVVCYLLGLPLVSLLRSRGIIPAR